MFCVLEFAKTESIVTVQRRFRIMYHTEPPTDKKNREWYMNSSSVAACSFRSARQIVPEGARHLWYNAPTMLPAVGRQQVAVTTYANL